MSRALAPPVPAPSLADASEAPGPRVGRIRGLGRRFRARWLDPSRWLARLPMLSILTVAALARLVNINVTGFNSDEAVYAGQAATLGGNEVYADYFPAFRAHPMIVQSILSLLFRTGEHDLAGRLFIVVVGVATVLLVFVVGKEIYDRRVGLVAAALMAVMPYHVVVTRQLLLDGPMVLFTTASLYCLVRAAKTDRLAWFVGAGLTMGMAMLCKESAIVMTASVYAFLALTPAVRRPIAGTLIGMATIVGVFAIHPISVNLAGGKSAAKSYLVWQLVRSPNHELWFYTKVVPPAIGILVLLAALLAVAHVVRQRRRAWREVLLVGWMAVPFTAFTLWPVKGFQYLLPGAPAIAILAGEGFVVAVPAVLARLPRLRDRSPRTRRWLAWGVLAVTLLSLVIPTAARVLHPERITGMAGTGGTPGGREMGHWIDAHTPAGSVFLTLGPSMANLVQYYGHRKAYGISVSPNPLRRNPSYEPIPNPDLALREGEMQYVVWDAFSARRSAHFSEVTLALARRYHGRIVHTETVDGEPVIVIYEVRP